MSTFLHGRGTFLDLDLVLQGLNIWVCTQSLLRRAILDRLSSLQVIEFSGQVLLQFRKLGKFLGLFMALQEVSIQNLHWNIMVT
jgi:hypothetical protein